MHRLPADARLLNCSECRAPILAPGEQKRLAIRPGLLVELQETKRLRFSFERQGDMQRPVCNKCIADQEKERVS